MAPQGGGDHQVCHGEPPWGPHLGSLGVDDEDLTELTIVPPVPIDPCLDRGVCLRLPLSGYWNDLVFTASSSATRGPQGKSRDGGVGGFVGPEDVDGVEKGVCSTGPGWAHCRTARLH